MSHRAWISISGLIWAVAGIFLLYKGLKILSGLSDTNTASWWIAAGLFIGFLKGRFVLARTVQRISKRILSLPAPIHFVDAYPKSYWLLISSMMALGVAMRLVPDQWHGFIDVAVGSALLNGAMVYFRTNRELAATK
jgi:hypothetical protein